MGASACTEETEFWPKTRAGQPRDKTKKITCPGVDKRDKHNLLVPALVPRKTPAQAKKQHTTGTRDKKYT